MELSKRVRSSQWRAATERTSVCDKKMAVSKTCHRQKDDALGINSFDAGPAHGRRDQLQIKGSCSDRGERYEECEATITLPQPSIN